MTEQVDFYILENPDIREKHRYACRIVQKAYAQGLTVYICMDDRGQCDHMDRLLWTYSQGSFIPHGVSDGTTLDWGDFPVQVGSSPIEASGAGILVNLGNDVPGAYGQFKRIVELVSGNPADKTGGRSRFRRYREQGLKPETHNIS